MFFRMYRLWLSLLLIGCCLVGFYYLQAEMGSAPSKASVSDSRRMGSPDGFLANPSAFATGRCTAPVGKVSQ